MIELTTVSEKQIIRDQLLQFLIQRLSSINRLNFIHLFESLDSETLIAWSIPSSEWPFLIGSEWSGKIQARPNELYVGSWNSRKTFMIVQIELNKFVFFLGNEKDKQISFAEFLSELNS